MKKLFLILLIPGFALAQQDNEPRGQEGQFTFDTDKPFKLLTLDEKIDEPIATKKKKPKKKVFYGIKTKKGFTRRGFGNKLTLELFYVLKKRDEKFTGFARDIYWYDYARREVRRTSAFDPKRGVLLHGPYKKTVGDVTVEEGIFYKGAKHGRWMAYNVQDLVENKSKYYKGWPKDSYVTYYDPTDRKHLKEVMPIEYGDKDGYYYMLFEDGTVAVRGEYKWNEKIGDWIENYPNGKRKRVIAYPPEPFKNEFAPYIRKEWDEKGKEIYSR
ncbi:MAG: hypothetical protein QM734_05515 [Cyclobacteriaceae bacterium]